MTTKPDQSQPAAQPAACDDLHHRDQEGAGNSTPENHKQPKSEKATKGRKMVATPLKRGKGKNATFSMRRRVRGYDISMSGFSSATAAKAAMKETIAHIEAGGRPAGLGANKTSVAQALQDYAMDRLPFLKGAAQDARRINAYLRAAGLSLLHLTKLETQPAERPSKAGKAGPRPLRGALFRIELVPHTHERCVPNGLHKYRKALLTANADTDKLRTVLATTPVAEVTRDQLQKLMDQMRVDGKSASTIALERAILRSLFNYAFSTWDWPELRDNPATKLKMPTVDNERSRVLSKKEQDLLDEALSSCRNDLVAPTLTLLRETAMRASEPLERALWSDVDWGRMVLTLRDAKTGSREVPLSAEALAALQQLQSLSTGKPDEPIVRISYEALRAAWRRALERAGIEDLHLQDLRHTAATRMALKTGNVFLVRALTGHKTIQMLERYVNVSADDVVEVMHARTEPQPLPALRVPPGNARARGEPAVTFTPRQSETALPASGVEVVGNVVYTQFRRQA